MDLTSILINLAIGIGFGFTLERSGFGNARRLAAQFYLYDMTVLKVMFTAIIWCMLLLFWCTALGWIDFTQIYVPPTFLWSALVGGIVLGIGFIVGGYCPGTSLVASVTGKIDGMFFMGGIFVGIFLFGETSPMFQPFYNHAGYLGRVTLGDWLGLDIGIVTLLVVFMALGMFWCAEKLERHYRGAAATGGDA